MKTIICPTCQGKHIINAGDPKYPSVIRICPTCNGKKNYQPAAHVKVPGFLWMRLILPPWGIGYGCRRTFQRRTCE